MATHETCRVHWSYPVEGFGSFMREYRRVTDRPLGSLPQRLIVSSDIQPITSYGVILRSKDGHYLVVKRVDSSSYLDIVRGNYRDSQLFLMIQALPEAERERLLTYSYDELWRDLYQQKGEAYEFGKEAFAKLSPHLSYLFRIVPPFDPDGKYMWSFPKGRPDCSIQESGYDCALRECFEETNGLDMRQARLMYPDPIVERYLGSNSKQYQTNYFVFEVDQILPVTQFDTKWTGIRDVSVGEISEIRWIDTTDADQYLPEPRLDIIRYIETHLPDEYPTGPSLIWTRPLDACF